MIDLYDLQRRWDAAGISRATSADEMVRIGEVLESVRSLPGAPDVLLECGAWTGFSSACLSWLCQEYEARLVVADSFAGLPQLPPSGRRDGATLYRTGDYACDRTRWLEHLHRFGLPRGVRVIPGWFAESLSGWREPLAVLWMDVDLGESARAVLSHALPWLDRRGALLSHETAPAIFTGGGRVDPAAENEVWREIRLALGSKPYHARFLTGCLGECRLRD